jgi:hypothetical protein
MEFDSSRVYTTVALPQYETRDPYDDPRTEEGELMWPERFDRAAVERLKNQLGPYMAAGRLQQLPVPKGGGIIQDIWWMNWTLEAPRYGLVWDPDKDIRDFPQMEIVVGSIDTALGEKEENDYSAMTVWGVWLDRAKNRRVMLMFAWAERFSLHGHDEARRTGNLAASVAARRGNPAIPRSALKDVVESMACKPGFSDRTPTETPVQASKNPSVRSLTT